MSLKLYKPNPRNTGALCSFQYGPAKSGGDLKGELSLWLHIVKQSSWNEAAKTGSFSGNAKVPANNIRVKFSEFEIGGLMNAIRRRVEFKAYHSFGQGHVQIQFAPTQDKTNGTFSGFGFGVTRDGKDKFYIQVTPAESENVICFLDSCLKRLYANRFASQYVPTGQRNQEQPDEQPMEQPPEEAPPEPPAASGEEGEPENPFG